MGMPVCGGAAVATLYIAAELAVLITALLSGDGQPPPVWLFNKHRYSRRSLALLVLTVLHHRHSVSCNGDLAVRCKSTAETCMQRISLKRNALCACIHLLNQSWHYINEMWLSIILIFFPLYSLTSLHIATFWSSHPHFAICFLYWLFKWMFQIEIASKECSFTRSRKCWCDSAQGV